MAKFELIPVSTGSAIASVHVSNNILIFPNPSIDNVNIYATTTLNGIQVFDMSGRMLMNVSDVNQNTYTMSLSALQSGVYMIRVVSADKITTQKLIKE